jgi:hypothetical protein
MQLLCQCLRGQFAEIRTHSAIILHGCVQIRRQPVKCHGPIRDQRARGRPFPGRSRPPQLYARLAQGLHSVAAGTASACTEATWFAGPTDWKGANRARRKPTDLFRPHVLALLCYIVQGRLDRIWASCSDTTGDVPSAELPRE